MQVFTFINGQRTKGVLLFYFFTYSAVYGSALFIKSYLKTFDIMLYLSIIAIATLAGSFLSAFLTLKLNRKKLAPSVFGFKKKGIKESFLLAAAVSTPIPLSWLMGIKIVGIDTLLVAAKPSWVAFPVSLNAVVFAIVFWTLIGIVAFALWQAFPYELMHGISPKFAILLIAILWSGLYNTPLLTGKLDPVDVLLFGFLFTWIYHKTRNSVGIIGAYLLNENPLWWTIAASFDNIEMAFLILLVFRTLICVVSLVLVVKHYR